MLQPVPHRRSACVFVNPPLGGRKVNKGNVQRSCIRPARMRRHRLVPLGSCATPAGLGAGGDDGRAAAGVQALEGGPISILPGHQHTGAGRQRPIPNLPWHWRAGTGGRGFTQSLPCCRRAGAGGVLRGPGDRRRVGGDRGGHGRLLRGGVRLRARVRAALPAGAAAPPAGAPAHARQQARQLPALLLRTGRRLWLLSCSVIL
jgi:hypothetical protein